MSVRTFLLFGVLHLVAALLAGPASAQSPSDRPQPEERPTRLTEIISKEISTYPATQVRDLYKLVHQGIYGIGHFIASRESAAGYLRNEIDGILPDSGESLITPCDAQGTQYRVHLRPFLAANYATERLLDAMMESAARPQPDSAEFARVWKQAGAIIRQLAPVLYDEQFDEFTRFVQLRDYPPVSHSNIYREAHVPAYRVVHRSALEKYLPELLPGYGLD